MTNIFNFLGYTIVRFKATNPGYWPFHCHAMMHNLEGMLILLRIKDPANPDRPYPPAGLPKCNSYKFDDNEYPWEKEAGILHHITDNRLVLLVIIIFVYQVIFTKHIRIHFLDNKDERDKKDYLNGNKIILNETWMTSYLEKEQQMIMKRLDQQETLLNITGRLLDKLHNELD